MTLDEQKIQDAVDICKKAGYKVSKLESKWIEL